MKLSVRILTTCMVVLLAPAAHAITITHTAKLIVCQLTDKVHGRCISTSEASFFNGTSVVDIDCQLTRDGNLADYRFESKPANRDTTKFTTWLSTGLLPWREYCVTNQSKYYKSVFFGVGPAYAGQHEAQDCLWTSDGTVPW